MNSPESPVFQREIKVWDPLVRLFHWSLVAAFAIAWLTGDDDSRWHELSGYVVVGLVAVRIIWGFVGTRYARFGDFVHSPAAIWGYTRDLLAGKARRYLGHNPLGGVMVVALLVALLATGLTGIVLKAAEEGSGPFASVSARVAGIGPEFITRAVADDDEKDGSGKNGEEFGEELHEFFTDLTLLLVGLHITGVLIGSLVHRENLIRAIFTGKKPA
ncbi:MAG: hypothetical protein A3E57_05080 [Candidatus Muproteobacteria bacterium RIFCSPHIGHO2_12_FULL_60_33]|uniref:Cytochrome b561 bacterial/Ni-hydrogenase domain-containing protein n=1 Tax=Candidatus Muproteobacteria bacterium RIFCSPLOWO2_01_FULL_60_18 TaxID=1817768 RepID=A0A1F6TX76_9PROT|nr:MAG: hypothetical protein A3A87_10060 [Candidatus Muproteobacteria bacterium RIFCSPLOWO2_01_FULL_60_18]OGI53212.1 MAG: hypothetical protein A2W42_07635 [Candidatus Muproteobacteria bacterium RIFCSPHIGHO2_01_60_12]OGI54902.1 MAG: hypothetical protein A3D32_08810 [Candidatus Muproteobacteria bacterium RIFCSPHIGHO2_02_FULL_60_13]OGI55944.1 MAG: hypothetical protein A3E57_05080 [Candidatus Muproteobacteria bacterium RIFCSPHIGHO2_12_FULL_60_33]OGI59345.1 MAG: hypothetical protein A2809_04345 [Can